MFRVSRARALGALAAGLLVSGTLDPGAATAATVQFDRFTRAELGAAQTAFDGALAGARNVRVETFEDLAAWNGTSGTSNPQGTRVGSFTSLGGQATGTARINGGTALEVRGDNTMRWGRYNTDRGALGGHWLDSNGTYGMRWEIAGLGRFDSIAFFLTDVADVGGRFSMRVGDTLVSDIAGADGRLANGNIHLVRILLPSVVETLTVELFHDRLNDGFGIDGAAIGRVAPVPLPAGVLLVLTGAAVLGGIGMHRRRRAAT